MSLEAIAAAANHLARLLEASAPKGLRHPKHARHIKPARAKIKAVMVHFFERQRKAVLAAVRPKITRELTLHPQNSAKVESWIADPFRDRLESPRAGDLGRRPYAGGNFPEDGNPGRISLKESSPQGKTFARALMPTSLHPLTFSATAGETEDYNEAITDLIGAAANSPSASAAVGDDIAGRYLAENSLSKLTGGLNATSIERLQDALADAWDKGGDYNSMVKAITDTFDDFTTSRAELIAQTEANDAYSEARRDTAGAMGLDEKRWDTDGEACPECQANADQGWIDIDEDFESGDDAPTAHPGCDCGCDYRQSSK